MANQSRHLNAEARHSLQLGNYRIPTLADELHSCSVIH